MRIKLHVQISHHCRVAKRDVHAINGALDLLRRRKVAAVEQGEAASLLL